MGTITCCKDCTDRHIGCHIDCERYLAEQEQIAARKSREKPDQEWQAYEAKRFEERRRRRK